MGRTIPTANMLIQEEIDSFLRTYGKGLSGEREREALYNLLQTVQETHAGLQPGRKTGALPRDTDVTDS